MSEPKQTCTICGQFIVVVDTGRGFPPELAKRKLQKLCEGAGHESAPKYTAGVEFGLLDDWNE